MLEGKTGVRLYYYTLCCARTFKNIFRHGRCPYGNNFVTRDLPDIRPVNLENDPEDDLKFGHQLNRVVLTACQMLSVELRREGEAYPVIEYRIQRLWRMITLYALMDAENPNRTALQRLIHKDGDIVTVIWHRLRDHQENRSPAPNMATHPMISVAEAQAVAAADIMEADRNSAEMAVCILQQEPLPDPRIRKGPQGIVCRICCKRNHAGEVLCPTCWKLLLPDDQATTLLDSLGNPYEVQMGEIVDRFCKHAKANRQATKYKIAGEDDVALRGKPASAGCYYRKIKTWMQRARKDGYTSIEDLWTERHLAGERLTHDSEHHARLHPPCRRQPHEDGARSQRW